ncbi:MAG: alpha/beta hydrolase [Bacteroidota bacterium]
MKLFKTVVLFITLSFPIHKANAQNDWVHYSRALSTKGYEGLRFRLTAMIKTEPADDSASAHLWVRVDKEKGMGFFDNMTNRPVRTKDWKRYAIEGKLDTGAYQLVFGAICRYNGKFYYDDVKLDVETSKGEWKNIFTESFENGNDTLGQGSQRWQLAANKNYTANIVADDNKTKVLMIEGKNVPNYGINNKVGKFADVNGIKLYYEIYGEGAPLVVLHGNGGSIKSASSFYPDLIKQYKVIAVDSRAQGRSTSTNEALTYDMMAGDVNALLEQLHIDSVFIWGQSDGAILALLLAKDYPKKVKRALAYAPNIQPDSLALFPWAITAMQKIVAEGRDPKEKTLNNLMLDYPNIPYTELVKIKAPVMIMCGDRDVIRPEHILKMFQNIPNSQLCILPGATHGGAWEKKEMFLSILNDFFNKPFKMPDTKSWYVQ